MEITKFSSQLSVALHQATLHLRQILNPAVERAKRAIEKMREFLAGFLDAGVVANAKIAQFGSQLLVALKKATLHLRLALNPLTERGKSALQKMPELLANSFDAAVAVNAKMTQFTSQFLVALKETPGHLRRALNPLTESGKGMAKYRMMSDLKNRFVVVGISRFQRPRKDLSTPLSQPPLLDFLQRPPLGFWNPPPDKEERGDRNGCVEQKNTRSSKQVNQRKEC